MKIIRKAVVVAACLMAAGAANAQLGGLGSMLSGGKPSASGGRNVSMNLKHLVES